MTLTMKHITLEIRKYNYDLNKTPNEVRALATFIIALSKARYKFNVDWETIASLLELADEFIQTIGV